MNYVPRWHCNCGNQCAHRVDRGGKARFPGVLLLVFAPTLSGLLQLALSRNREYDADLDGAYLLGDSHALAAALRKIDHLARPLLRQLLLPGVGDAAPSLLRSHPPTAEQVRRLKALMSECAAPFDEPATFIIPADVFTRPAALLVVGKGVATSRHDNCVDLNGDAHRQGSSADGEAGVFTGIAEDFDKEVRSTINDGWMLAEISSRNSRTRRPSQSGVCGQDHHRARPLPAQ